MISTASTTDVLLAGGQNDLDGTAPEAEIVADLVRRALPFIPVPVAIGTLIAGVDGALSAGVGIALVLVNFVAAAASLAWAARINLGVLMGVSLFGYLLRISVMFGAVFLLRDLDWVHVAVLGCTIVVTHLGLLAWELKYVSASLAHPALKPQSLKSTADKEPIQ